MGTEWLNLNFFEAGGMTCEEDYRSLQPDLLAYDLGLNT